MSKTRSHMSADKFARLDQQQQARRARRQAFLDLGYEADEADMLAVPRRQSGRVNARHVWN